MRTRAIEIGLLLLGAMTLPSVVGAQAVTPCAPDSPEVGILRDAVGSWTRDVAAAAPGSDATLLQSRYGELFELSCARMAPEVDRPVSTTVLSMQAWLGEGGLNWLYGLASSAPTLQIPPGARSELTTETAAADDTLAPLLCSAADESCGRATAGWRLRAAQAFGQIAASLQQNSAADLAERRAACLEEAKARPEAERYAAWSRCVQHAVPQRAALPLGATSAPERGWFVLRGRRGHYSYCEEVRAYDLSTGAAYVVRDCGRILNLPAAGASRTGAEIGRLPVDALREAAWMTLFARRVEWTERSATIDVPPTLRRVLPPTGAVGAQGSSWGWGSSAQTRLSWAWVDGSRTLASGTLTWPDSMYPGENHADELWRVAEAAFEPGCAPARLPRRLELGPNRSGVSPVDATPGQRRPIETSLESRLRGLDRGDCRRRRRR